MFTGIVQEIGSLQRKRITGDKYQLVVTASKVLKDIDRGDSIAVNGVCLTVVDRDSSCFTADVMPATVENTNLHGIVPGDRVNLEQAVRADGFLGGHLVTGHIDGVGQVRDVVSQKNAQLVKLAVTQELNRFMVDKGSVALNGVSLTIAGVEGDILKISLIPETWNNTTFKYIKPGDQVNIEADIIGKYVAKYMADFAGEDSKYSTGINREMLRQNGFI